MAEEYVDLSDVDKDAYECQRCKMVFQEEFERSNCPNCDTGDGMFASAEWAQEMVVKDYGNTPYGNKRVVRGERVVSVFDR